MRDYSAKDSSVMHFHARGRIAAEETCRLFEEYGLNEASNVKMSDYIYDMPKVMAAADIVICRAGAMTLSEIAYMKKASIIIPSPNVTDNHQFKNAKVICDGEGALMLEEKDFGTVSLTEMVKELAENEEKRRRLEAKIADFVRYDVGRLIYGEICELFEKYKSGE